MKNRLSKLHKKINIMIMKTLDYHKGYPTYLTARDTIIKKNLL